MANCLRILDSSISHVRRFALSSFHVQGTPQLPFHKDS